MISREFADVSEPNEHRLNASLRYRRNQTAVDLRRRLIGRWEIKFKITCGLYEYVLNLTFRFLR